MFSDYSEADWKLVTEGYLGNLYVLTNWEMHFQITYESKRIIENSSNWIFFNANWIFKKEIKKIKNREHQNLPYKNYPTRNAKRSLQAEMKEHWTIIHSHTEKYRPLGQVLTTVIWRPVELWSFFWISSSFPIWFKGQIHETTIIKIC